MPDFEAVVMLLVIAGVVAGLIGTAGCITSLVSYPALLVAGATPLQANVANIVALIACWPASAVASRTELRAVRSALPVAVAAAAVGGGLGAVLLLHTESSAFDAIVPVLVAGGSAALLAQPTLSRLNSARSPHPSARFAMVGLVAIYGGYFGAGSGVMLLVVALLFFDEFLPHANALKNMCNGGVTAAASCVLVAAGPVPWDLVVPLAAGMLVGSLLGPVVVRRSPAALIRWAVAALGFGLAIDLAIAAWT